MNSKLTEALSDYVGQLKEIYQLRKQWESWESEGNAVTEDDKYELDELERDALSELTSVMIFVFRSYEPNLCAEVQVEDNLYAHWSDFDVDCDGSTIANLYFTHRNQ